MQTKAQQTPRRIVVLSLPKKAKGKRRREFVPPRTSSTAVQRPCGIPIAVGRSVVTKLRLNHSPTRIAKDVGLHRSTIYRIKNGRSTPDGQRKEHWIHAEIAKGSGRCGTCGGLLLAKRCLKCELERKKST